MSQHQNQNHSFHLDHTLEHVKHVLPAQAPLKDFIHHNTLHAFQYLTFKEGLLEANSRFGYRVLLTAPEYQEEYAKGRIQREILEKVIGEEYPDRTLAEVFNDLFDPAMEAEEVPRIGALRAFWKRKYRLDMDARVHPFLFRLLCSYLDQGISIWPFPERCSSFLSALRHLDKATFVGGLFRTKRARSLFHDEQTTIESLLDLMVGDSSYFEQYLFDQQFAHQGWSGMTASIEGNPDALLSPRPISLHDLIMFELLLELDVLDDHFPKGWKPLMLVADEIPVRLFDEIHKRDKFNLLFTWQRAYEWSYYDQVLAGLLLPKAPERRRERNQFQAIFCIDDRECSLRRYIERLEPNCSTYGTPGFFGVEFFYQPDGGLYQTKLCPAPVTPKFVIHETNPHNDRSRDAHFSKASHSFHSGWLASQTLGFWSALKLARNIFSPTMQPASTSSFKHMDGQAKLSIERLDDTLVNGRYAGFSVSEMTERVKNLLFSIGLVDSFAPVVYIIGHGASSVNNPHYAAYDCGACSGRAGSVNARVMSFMANHPEVRKALVAFGIEIPESTVFIGGLHDTTRDEIQFYDADALSQIQMDVHAKADSTMTQALDANAKERSRRFMNIDTAGGVSKIHDRIRQRSIALFEPRPELNHATNAVCIVGSRELSAHLFLDRRAFMNSYDYRIDPEGNYLFNIIKPIPPVCGGINLEYYFSRTDNNKLGAGSKLPHNVMGLIGVANGTDGDLRPGLPSQMIEVHEPIRLLIIVEHYPEIVNQVIRRLDETFEWFKNQWVHLAVKHPDEEMIYAFDGQSFKPYQPASEVRSAGNIARTLETSHDHLPVMTI
ncbi:MAG: YbcC family protein [Flavobacteriales bacterium]